MIHDPMMLEIIQCSQSAAPYSHTTALCDWIFLGRYYGFCKSMWCNDHHTTFAWIEDPLWSGPDAVSFIAEDFSFFTRAGVRLSNIASLFLDQGSYSTILHH